jgi:hypothetical protein
MDTNIKQEIIQQLNELMERSGIDAIETVGTQAAKDDHQAMEDTLTNLKSLNARYDRDEAIEQIRCLMEKYNIQLDQLIDRRGMA